MSGFDENLYLIRLKEAVAEDTLEDFVQKTGIDEASAGLILNGEKDSKVSELVRISNAYDVSIEWLLCQNERKEIVGTTESDSAWLHLREFLHEANKR